MLGIAIYDRKGFFCPLHARCKNGIGSGPGIYAFLVKLFEFCYPFRCQGNIGPAVIILVYVSFCYSVSYQIQFSFFHCRFLFDKNTTGAVTNRNGTLTIWILSFCRCIHGITSVGYFLFLLQCSSPYHYHGKYYQIIHNSHPVGETCCYYHEKASA
ncbi:hypothetical protein SDC9_208540 [bioreactor metagenome]|uniref:Uncharacterized protein n=1 Tax=bioreactor metagenome TaxID=1076179 RepID=A0A645JAX4_9ZZZZ